MVTGQQPMEKLKDNTTIPTNTLSILITQDGFSFCILSNENEVIQAEKIGIPKTSNYAKELLLKLQEKINVEFVLNNQLKAVKLTYENDTFSLVPNLFFDPTKLSHYIKYSTAILANDYFAYDSLQQLPITNIYIPYVHINNYLHEIFGEFEYQHHLSLLLDSLYNEKNKSEICFGVITRNYLNLLCFKNQEVLLCNAYAFETTEDIAYYLLFALEQLGVNREELQLYLSEHTENELLLAYVTPYVKTVKSLMLSDFLNPKIKNTQLLNTQVADELLLLNL